MPEIVFSQLIENTQDEELEDYGHKVLGSMIVDANLRQAEASNQTNNVWGGRFVGDKLWEVFGEPAGLELQKRMDELPGGDHWDIKEAIKNKQWEKADNLLKDIERFKPRLSRLRTPSVASAVSGVPGDDEKS